MSENDGFVTVGGPKRDKKRKRSATGFGGSGQMKQDGRVWIRREVWEKKSLL